MFNRRSTQLDEIEIKLEIDEIPDHIVKNVESIAKIQVQQGQPDHFHLQLLDRLAIFGTRPAFLYTLVAFFLLWWTASGLHDLGLIDWDIPAYRLQDRLLDTMALFISTAILIRQTRQEQVADRQSHLMLQLDLVTEQKITKIIALLEELRSDLPNVHNRIDLEAELMQQSTDPELVIAIIQENLQPAEQSTGSVPSSIS